MSIEGPRVGGYRRNIARGKAVKENRGSVDVNSQLRSWGREDKGSTTWKHVKEGREGRERGEKEREFGEIIIHVLHFQRSTGRGGGSNIHTPPIKS